jgi:hypothetical protein
MSAPPDPTVPWMTHPELLAEVQRLRERVAAIEERLIKIDEFLYISPETTKALLESARKLDERRPRTAIEDRADDRAN